MKWLTNTFNPSHPDAYRRVSARVGQTQKEAFAEKKQWLAGKVIGPPKASDKYTVEQLRAMNMVGVYTR